MNRTLKLLIFSDIFVLTGFGLISPILAVFIKENLIGGTIAAAGIAVTITILLRCTLQLIFSYFGKPKQRYLMIILGTFIIAMVPFVYIFSTTVYHIYIAAAIHGVGAGLANPAWFSLFASNLKKGRKGWEWSVYSSSVGLGTAIAAFGGSQLATLLGFKPVFIIVGILALFGCFVLIALTKKEIQKESKHTQIVSGKMKLHNWGH